MFHLYGLLLLYLRGFCIVGLLEFEGNGSRRERKWGPAGTEVQEFMM